MVNILFEYNRNNFLKKSNVTQIKDNIALEVSVFNVNNILAVWVVFYGG